MPIRILPETLASQIAAGEVVERPASVVKELVENALDAGASTINVEIRDGGHKLIQIGDNGNGIEETDIEVAFKRHATSKITQVEDLNTIRTLGFRGEALAAISAVSQVTLVTRSGDGQAGNRLVVHGGDVVSRETVGAPQGTVISVENVFYNVPARLKFLKSQASERRVIDEFVTRYALAYPEVRFRLIHNGRITFQSSGNGQLRDVLVAVYGPDIARQLLPVGEQSEAGKPEDTGHTIHVRGFASPPSLHRSNRSQIILFVNGRWVKDTQLTYAIVQAYHTLLPSGRFPIAILFVSMPYDEVDVNVHPTKSEVRFRRANKVFGAVQKTVREGLVANSPVRGFTQLERQDAIDWGGSLDRPDLGRRHPLRPQMDFSFNPQTPDGVSLPEAWQEDVAQIPTLSRQPQTGNGQRLPVMRVVGQVGAAYIITEGPDGMFMIDQHAAHERILYEQFMAARQRQEIPSQSVISGSTVHLTPDQSSLLEENLEMLADVGFKIEPFGPNTFVVQAVPAILARQDPARALMLMVEDLESGNEPMQEEVEARIIIRVCKTAAIKAGQTLSREEMQAMIEQLERCHNPHTCPHGRPTLIHLSMMQLAREFGRT